MFKRLLCKKSTMIKWNYLFLVLICLSLTSCATLFTAQEYVLIDQEITKEITWYGVIYSIPERATIHKIVLLGTGKVQNYAISVRDKRNEWKPFKHIKRVIEFPFEILINAETDAIKISHYSVVGRGRVNTIQLYTLVDKNE